MLEGRGEIESPQRGLSHPRRRKSSRKNEGKRESKRTKKREQCWGCEQKKKGKKKKKAGWGGTEVFCFVFFSELQKKKLGLKLGWLA